MENDTIKGRLLVVEHQNKEIKEAVKEILEKLDNLDDRYPTRREVAVFNWIIVTTMAAIGTIIAILKIK